MKLIADNLRITRPDVRDALERRDPEPVKALADRCARRKPWAIDVNTGPLTRDPKTGMQFFVRAVESATGLPLLIDTSNPAAMRAGLEAASNPAIINGFSLEPRKVELILPLAREFDTDIVGFLLYPDSRVPKDDAQRMEIALELFEKAKSAGVPKERVIIDPVVPPLAWENGIEQARAVIRLIQTLPDLLGFKVRTIAGISNLTTGAPDRNKKLLMDSAYLSMLARAGLDYALMDIFNTGLVGHAKAASILSNESLFSWGMVPE